MSIPLMSLTYQLNIIFTRYNCIINITIIIYIVRDLGRKICPNLPFSFSTLFFFIHFENNGHAATAMVLFKCYGKISKGETRDKYVIQMNKTKQKMNKKLIFINPSKIDSRKFNDTNNSYSIILFFWFNSQHHKDYMMILKQNLFITVI